MLADAESRKIRQIEWKLDTKVFKKLQEMRGPLAIDLFASRISHQLPIYISWLPDPKAWKIDAFSIDWNLEGIYCFPPFCLISRILHRMILQQASMLIIVPLWQQRPWYPQLLDSSSRLSHSTTKDKHYIRPCTKKNHDKCKLELDSMYYFGKNSKRRNLLEKLEKF